MGQPSSSTKGNPALTYFAKLLAQEAASMDTNQLRSFLELLETTKSEVERTPLSFNTTKRISDYVSKNFPSKIEEVNAELKHREQLEVQRVLEVTQSFNALVAELPAKRPLPHRLMSAPPTQNSSDLRDSRTKWHILKDCYNKLLLLSDQDKAQLLSNSNVKASLLLAVDTMLLSHKDFVDDKSQVVDAFEQFFMLRVDKKLEDGQVTKIMDKFFEIHSQSFEAYTALSGQLGSLFQVRVPQVPTATLGILDGFKVSVTTPSSSFSSQPETPVMEEVPAYTKIQMLRAMMEFFKRLTRCFSVGLFAAKKSSDSNNGSGQSHSPAP